jgi:1-acyl-sn-glycerol-3-phosphate acyltransferase
MHIFSGIIRMLVFVIGTPPAVAVNIIMVRLTGRVKWAQIWHSFACLVFGIKIRVVGTPREHAATPTVFLSNHVSYLDIVVLGSQIEAIFVAKADVANWPVFGFLAKTQRTIFIERTRQALEDSKRRIAAILNAKNNIILFGEGTSTDGRTVLPFKAGLLEMLYEQKTGAMLQPTVIVIEKIGGKRPDEQAVRDLYAWWRPEDTLAPHLWNFAKAGGAQIAIHYLPPLDPANYPERKALAQAATDAVTNVLLLASRPE